MHRVSVRTLLTTTLTLSVAFTLLSGNLLHSLIPHEHGPNGSETAVWGSLHAALQHEDKKMVLVPALGVGSGLIVVFLYQFRIRRTVPLQHDAFRSYLARGIAPYRKFG
ncbi:MAG: hypothetical protein WDZ93_01650 [Candidatus Paceibacterota bacterium]